MTNWNIKDTERRPIPPVRPSIGQTVEQLARAAQLGNIQRRLEHDHEILATLDDLIALLNRLDYSYPHTHPIHTTLKRIKQDVGNERVNLNAYHKERKEQYRQLYDELKAITAQLYPKE